MDDLEKVETIRTKCNVSYTDAKACLLYTSPSPRDCS